MGLMAICGLSIWTYQEHHMSKSQTKQDQIRSDDDTETVRVQSSGSSLRSTVPQDIADQADIEAGDLLVFEVLGEGELRVRDLHSILERVDDDF